MSMPAAHWHRGLACLAASTHASPSFSVLCRCCTRSCCQGILVFFLQGASAAWLQDVDMRSPLGALTVAAAAAAAAPDAAWRRSGTSSRRATPHGGATPALGTTRPALPPVQVRTG